MRIRIGHASSHLLTPLLQFLLKICDATSALLDEVFRLAKVLGKVIDLDVASSVKVFDQLPVTLTNAAGRAINDSRGIVSFTAITIILAKAPPTNST